MVVNALTFQNVAYNGSTPCLKFGASRNSISVAISNSNLKISPSLSAAHTPTPARDVTISDVFTVSVLKFYNESANWIKSSYSVELSSPLFASVTMAWETDFAGCARPRTVGEWGDPSRWSLGQVPVRKDNVFFPSNSGVIFITTDTSVNSLQMNGGLLLAHSTSCPDGWSPDPTGLFGAKCYRLFENATSYTAAEETCTESGYGSLDAHLVEVSGREELSVVKRICRGGPALDGAYALAAPPSPARDGGCWIGLRKDRSTQQFQWIQPLATTSGFRDWHRGEPNNHTVSEGLSTSGESCVLMQPWQADPLTQEQGSWNDNNCVLPKAFVCQIFARTIRSVLSVGGRSSILVSQLSGGGMEGGVIRLLGPAEVGNFFLRRGAAIEAHPSSFGGSATAPVNPLVLMGDLSLEDGASLTITEGAVLEVRQAARIGEGLRGLSSLPQTAVSLGGQPTETLPRTGFGIQPTFTLQSHATLVVGSNSLTNLSLSVVAAADLSGEIIMSTSTVLTLLETADMYRASIVAPHLLPFAPSAEPTTFPTPDPSSEPTFSPTSEPTLPPTARPSAKPTAPPSSEPTSEPTRPTSEPTFAPTAEPTLADHPTREPTKQTTTNSTSAPSPLPTRSPISPSATPTTKPSANPTPSPTALFRDGAPAQWSVVLAGDSARLTAYDSFDLVLRHRGPVIGIYLNVSSEEATILPTLAPTRFPSAPPVLLPTTPQPSFCPSYFPTKKPSRPPTLSPSLLPIRTSKTNRPSFSPSPPPTRSPTRAPTRAPTPPTPTARPTIAPTTPTAPPTLKPTAQPTLSPTSAMPSSQPSRTPSRKPSNRPSSQPSSCPSSPSSQPSSRPSLRPSLQPSSQPSSIEINPIWQLEHAIGVYKLILSEPHLHLSPLSARFPPQSTPCIPYDASAEYLANVLTDLAIIKETGRGAVTVRRYGDGGDVGFGFGYTYRIEMDAPTSSLFAERGPLLIEVHCVGIVNCECGVTIVPLVDVNGEALCPSDGKRDRRLAGTCVIPPSVSMVRISALQQIQMAAGGKLSIARGVYRLPATMEASVEVLGGTCIVTADRIDWYEMRTKGGFVVIGGNGWIGWDSANVLFQPAWTDQRVLVHQLNSAPGFHMTLSRFKIGGGSSVATVCPHSNMSWGSGEWTGGVIGGRSELTITQSLVADGGGKALRYGMTLLVQNNALMTWQRGNISLADGAFISIVGTLAVSSLGGRQFIGEAILFDVQPWAENPELLLSQSARQWYGYFDSALPAEARGGWYINPLCGDQCLRESVIVVGGETGLLTFADSSEVTFMLPLQILQLGQVTLQQINQIRVSAGGTCGSGAVIQIPSGSTLELTESVSKNLPGFAMLSDKSTGLSCKILGVSMGQGSSEVPAADNAGSLLITGGTHSSGLRIDTAVTISGGVLLWPLSAGDGQTLLFANGLTMTGVGRILVEPWSTVILVGKAPGPDYKPGVTNCPKGLKGDIFNCPVYVDVFLNENCEIRFPDIGTAAQPSMFDEPDAPDATPRGRFEVNGILNYNGGTLHGKADFTASLGIILSGSTKYLRSLAKLINNGHSEWGQGDLIMSDGGDFVNLGTLQMTDPNPSTFTGNSLIQGTIIPEAAGGDVFALNFHSWDADMGAINYQEYIRLRNEDLLNG